MGMMNYKIEKCLDIYFIIDLLELLPILYQ